MRSVPQEPRLLGQSHKHALISNRHPPKTPKNPSSITTITLILLLVCSFFFALYNSNRAYTSDEVWSIRTAALDFGPGMAALKADVHPPLYFQILHEWIRLFGTGERTVRLLSGLFYLLSVVALYTFARALYGSKAALFCAALYLTSPLAILSAQFVRMYSFLSLLSILSTWLYLQFSIRPRNSYLLFTLYILVNILGTFTHVAFFFLLFGQIIFHLLFYRRVLLKKFLSAVVLSLVPYLFLWAPILLAQIRNSREGLAWVKKPGFSMLADLFLLYGGAFWLVVPVLLFLWWRRGFKSYDAFTKIGVRSFPLALLAVTVGTPLLISLVKPVFNSRLAIVGLHLFALTIAAAIGRANNYLLPVVLTVLTVIFLTVFNPQSTSCDNRTMATYLGQAANDGDVIIYTSLTRLPIDYYLEQSGTTKLLFETSFPAEIDRHPGYEGRITDPERRGALEREAKELVDKISTMKAGIRGLRIFFFRGAHPEIDSILEKRLRERFQLQADQEVHCPSSASYFTDISVYSQS